jgi:hypothetical protein
MDLKHMRFFRAEGYINFTVFCDVPCRVRYLESVPVPMSASPVEVYAIEPGHDTQWIAVQQRDEDKRQIQFFVREGSLFGELPLGFIPKQLRSDIEERMGELGLSSSRANAA